MVSTEAKAEVARAAGATDVVMADGFKDAVKELTDGRGVDVVVDPVGGDRFTDSLRSLAPGGRLLVIGFTGGDIPTVKVNRLLLNNVDAVGVGWGAWAGTHPGYLFEQWAELEPLLASGAVSAPEPVVYPFERAADAIASLEDRTAAGQGRRHRPVVTSSASLGSLTHAANTGMPAHGSPRRRPRATATTANGWPKRSVAIRAGSRWQRGAGQARRR